MFPASDDAFVSLFRMTSKKQSQQQHHHRRIYIDTGKGKAIFLPPAKIDNQPKPQPPTSPGHSRQNQWMNWVLPHFLSSMFAGITSTAATEGPTGGGGGRANKKVVPIAMALEQQGRVSKPRVSFPVALV